MAVVINTVTSTDKLSLINANFSTLAAAINDSLLWRNGNTAGETLFTRDVDFNGKSLLNAYVGGTSLSELATQSEVYASNAAISATEAAADALASSSSAISSATSASEAAKYAEAASVPFIGATSFSALRSRIPLFSGDRVYLQGHTTAGQGGGWFYASFGVATDNGITIASGPGYYWTREVISGRLSVHDGGVVIGTADQAVLLQNIINYCHNNSLMLVGNKNLTVYCATGVTVPPGLHADWQGTTIQQHSAMTAGSLVSCALGTATAPGRYVKGRPFDNLFIRGKYHATLSNTPDFTNNVYGLNIGSPAQQTSGIPVYNIHVSGFKRGVVFSGPSSYLWTFYDAQVGICWDRGVSYEATADSGENIRFIGGAIYNCINASFNGLGFGMESTASTLDIVFNLVSFDYNDIDGTMQHSQVSVVDCHSENNNNNPKWVLNSTSGKAQTHFLASRGRMVGGPGQPQTGIPFEDNDGRPAFISMTGSNIDVSVQDVSFDDFKSTARKSVILVNTGGGTQRRINIKPLMDGSPNAGSGIPILSYSGINQLYVRASGSTSYWTLNGGSGTVISADTTTFMPRDTGSRKVVTSGASTGGSIVQTIPCLPGQTLVAKVGIKTSGLTQGSARMRIIFYARDGSTLISDTISPRGVTADSSSFTDVSYYGQVPSGAYFMLFQDYWTGLPATSVTLYFSGEYVQLY